MKFLSFIDYPYMCGLSMARIATCQTPYLVLLYQLSAHRNLVRRRSVDRIENILLGPDITLRMLMTVDAPPHVESVLPPRDGHLSKLAMARRATDSFADMNAVIEIDKIRQGVHPVPHDGFARSVTGPHRFQHGGVCPKLRMARHAGVRGRKARVPGRLNRRVAVPAINSELRRVVFMAERNRLRNRTIDVCEIGRLIDLPGGVADKSNDKNDAINARLGNGVHAAMKDLRHFESLTSKPAE